MQQTARYNGLAIAGFVVALCSTLVNYFGLAAIAGLVLSIVGKNQISARGDRGRGMAIAGIIISLISLAYTVIVLVTAQNTVNTLLNSLPSY